VWGLEGEDLEGVASDCVVLDGVALDGWALDGEALDGEALVGLPLEGVSLEGDALDDVCSVGEVLDGGEALPLSWLALGRFGFVNSTGISSSESALLGFPIVY
jgi:hypothetical protein